MHYHTLFNKRLNVDKILAEGLMFHCLNWGDSICQAEAREFFDISEIKRPGEEIRRLPMLNELNKLNELCRQCPEAFFEIYKKECPACGSNQIVRGFVTGRGNSALKSPQILYPYYCVACGKSLFSGVEL